MPYFSRDTIAQIGTPPGHGLVGALRLSGDQAFDILRRTAPDLDAALSGTPRRAALVCRFMVELTRRRDGGPERTILPCPARALVMPGPASYTREDVAEIHLPGSPALLGAALRTLVGAGARAAAPGEFTFRAFRNGRLSLGQAEAVEEIIRSADAADCRRALARLGERGRRRIEVWFDRTMNLAARVEAALDFSDEELDGGIGRELAAMAVELEREGCSLSDGRAATTGDLPHIALVGNANAGKSSLFNALFGEDATLVSPRAATTRDSLRREMRIDGARFVLSDNPGYHPTGAGAAGQASDNAFARLGAEDVACWVVDGSRPLDASDEAFVSRLGGTAFIVVTKADLPAATSPADAGAFAAARGLVPRRVLRVSAKTGEGIGELRSVLGEAGKSAVASGQWNNRELLELSRALEGCRAAANELAGPERLELAAEDLRAASGAFSRALGLGYAEEALQRIFSSFCIGK